MFWCEGIRRQLIAAEKQHRLSHALLFLGSEGLGKQALAREFAQYVLCAQKTHVDEACGLCQECRLWLAGHHGDFYCIDTHDKSIGIDYIREMTHHAYQSSQRGRRKVFLIVNAHLMTISAVNALLKTLEEPPLDCLFMLTSESKAALSPTLLSRCQHYVFFPGLLQDSLAWLQTADKKYSPEDIQAALYWACGAPLKAKQCLDDNKVANFIALDAHLEQCIRHQRAALEMTEFFQTQSLHDILQATLMLCHRLLKDHALSNRQMLHRCWHQALSIKKMLASGVALNEALLKDSLIFNHRKPISDVKI